MRPLIFSILTVTIFCMNSTNAQINEIKLTPSNRQNSYMFGYAVASDSNYIVVGSPGAPYPYDHFGSAYVFEKSDGVWQEKCRLTARDSSISAQFGYSVSVSGDYILIGAFRDPENGIQSGAAYIFHRDSSGEWKEQQKLVPSDGSAYDEFGTSVSLWGDYAIIGAPFDHINSVETGSAYIFKRDSSAWVEAAKLVASNSAGKYPKFGISVSIYGNYAIIGAYSDEEFESHPGAAYIFYDNGANWVQQAKLNASDVEMNHLFGHSVSIYKDYAAVGSSQARTATNGAAFIYHRKDTTWTEEAMVEGSSSFYNIDFGLSVSMDGDYLVVGAPDEDTNGNHSGCAYFFKRDGLNWREHAKIIASDGGELDMMGWSVFIEGDQVLCGAFRQETGVVYIYSGFATGISEPGNPALPDNFCLKQNYPNPFNPLTNIQFDLPGSGDVQLIVYDILGRQVAILVNQKMAAGSHEIQWNTHGMPSGIYLYQLKAGNPSTGTGQSFVETRKMILVR